MPDTPTKRGVFTRMLDEARLPVPVPHWFLVLRAVTRSLLYGLLVLWVALVPPIWPRRYFILGALVICWLVLVISLVIELRHSRRSGQSWRPRVSDALLVLAPLMVAVGLPWVGVVLMLVGYFIQLRRISAGEIFTFTVIGALMATIIATMALVDVEGREAGSILGTPFEAGKFAVIEMFNLNGIDTAQPVSDAGQVIQFFLQMIGIVLVAGLAAGMLTALVGQKGAEQESKQNELLSRVVAQQEEILRRLDRLQADEADR